MRQRARRSAIVLVTALACLLFTTNRASAEDGITVTVPVNVTNLHEDVLEVLVTVNLNQLQPNGGYYTTGTGSTKAPVVNGSVQQDVEVLVTQDLSGAYPSVIFNRNYLAAEQYMIRLVLIASTRLAGCRVEGSDFTNAFGTVDQFSYWKEPYLSNTHSDGCREGWNLMEMYSDMEGPISDLIPE